MSCNSKSSNNSSSEDDTNELRRGPWTVDEDTLLIHYIARHGEGRWNLLAKRSGLRRTGKSCRLRWLNYLKPDVKRGNLSPEEQLLILDLHSKWGNRWSKIAQCLPGRTDNEIKNYWRTRVQKQAKHLKIDIESAAFRDIIRRFWMPRLLQKIEGTSSLAMATIQTTPEAPLPNNIDSASQQHYSSPQAVVSGHGNLNMSGLSNMNDQSSDSEHCPNSCVSTSKALNISHISQFSKYPNCPFQPMVSNDYNTFADGCAYAGENNGYDMDIFNQSSNVSAAGGVIENPPGGCHVASTNWVDSDFLDGMWNLDELWQHRS